MELLLYLGPFIYLWATRHRYQDKRMVARMAELIHCCLWNSLLCFHGSPKVLFQHDTEPTLSSGDNGLRTISLWEVLIYEDAPFWSVVWQSTWMQALSPIYNKFSCSDPELIIILLLNMLFYQLHSGNLYWANVLFISRAPASNSWLVNKNSDTEAIFTWNSIRCPEMA